MNTKYILRNLQGLDELSLFNNFKNNGKICTLQIDPYNYALLIYSVQSYRISFIKLSLEDLISNFNNDIFDFSYTTNEIKPIELYLLHVFCLPFPLLNVVCTKRNVWAVGQETVVNLKPYIVQALEKAKSYENDDSMDVDAIEEFQPNMFDVQIDVYKLERYNLHLNDIFIGCHFLDDALIRCYKNSSLSLWELEFLLSEDDEISSDVVAFSFLNFPISYNKRCLDIVSSQDQNDAHKPLVIFIHHSDSESHSFKNIFGINCSSPNVICLIGHSDGRLLWALCDSSKEFRPSHELQALFDIKQPIIGIFFIKNIEQLKDCDCMLLVGALGQLTLISSKKYPSFIQEPGSHTFWTRTSHITSSITDCDIAMNCLLCISSDGVLSLVNLSVIFNPSHKSEELNSALISSEFDCIDQMIVADRTHGLILLKTKFGNIYLSQLKKIVESETVASSLPSLMNDCLKQSNRMQELLNKKVLQNRLFASISTFATLKFLRNTLKEPVTFSISEIQEEPRKYILVINFKCLDNLKLDSELCYVTSTIFSYFKNSNSFLTKTAPYNADDPTLCLELIDTVLQPPFISIFPLFVEVGLTLQLPENWKLIDCFKPVSSFLPFYLRIQTFMVHELNLLQNNALCFPQSLKLEIPKTLKVIRELGMARPVSNVLKIDSVNDFNFPKKFNLCLSLSSVEEMLTSTCDSDPCKYIQQLLFGNALESSMFKVSNMMSKLSPISINVSKNQSHIVITLTADNTDSLIGLRIAVMEILLSTHKKCNQPTTSSTYVNIPASLYRRCEEISKSLMSLYGQDIESDEVIHSIIHLYKELRTDVSGKLPIL